MQINIYAEDWEEIWYYKANFVIDDDNIIKYREIRPKHVQFNTNNSLWCPSDIDWALSKITVDSINSVSLKMSVYID
jgi:hypothetical protein